LPDSVLNISVWAMPNPLSFRYFKTSPEIIQLAVMLYVRFPLSLRSVEDLLHESGRKLSICSVLVAKIWFSVRKPDQEAQGRGHAVQ
jgi:hypothetical protein